MFVTYLTIYSGNKLPPFYIGYTSKNKIDNGYRGSVTSERYKNIWKKELQENPQLFKTKIISLECSKEQALQKEEYFHKCLKVHQNDLYINQRTGNWKFTTKKTLSEKHKQKIGMSNSKALKGRKLSEDHKQKLRGRTHTEEFKRKTAERMKGNSYCKGRKLSEDRKQKLRGRPAWNKGMSGFLSGETHYRFGQTVPKDIRDKISNTLKNNQCRAKTYLVDGEKIKNMKALCREKNWPYQYVMTKVGKSYKGHAITEYPSED